MINSTLILSGIFLFGYIGATVFFILAYIFKWDIFDTETKAQHVKHIGTLRGCFFDGEKHG